MNEESSELVLNMALAHGFDLVGISPAGLNKKVFDRYKGWVTQGRAGSMAYMERDTNRRRSVISIMPKAKSVIVVGVNYYRPERERAGGGRLSEILTGKKPLVNQPTGQIARYASGRDYHKIMGKALKRFMAELKEKYPKADFKSYVDTGAVLERAYAEQAGLGAIGKNTMLINDNYGSWIFLGEVITTLELVPTNAEEGRVDPGTGGTGVAGGGPPEASPKDVCGYCRLCLDICPTGALTGPYEMDAKLCISYLTIEHRGSIPEELRPLIGDWLYGCDLCQEICPQNNVAGPQGTARMTGIHLQEELVVKRIGGDFQLLEDILNLRTDEEFDERFAGSPMRRAKREGLVRNACVVTANVGARELLPLLKRISKSDTSELVREHAEWAIRQLETTL